MAHCKESDKGRRLIQQQQAVSISSLLCMTVALGLFQYAPSTLHAEAISRTPLIKSICLFGDDDDDEIAYFTVR